MTNADPLTEAGEQSIKWTRKRDRLIVKARGEGLSLRAIAARAGVSHQQVKNIFEREQAE